MTTPAPSDVPEREPLTAAIVLGLGHGGVHWLAAAFYLLLPYLSEELGLSYAQAGLFVSVLHVASTATNAVSGALVDLSGRYRPSLFMALGIGALGFMALAWSSNLLVLAGAVAMVGIANNLWHPPTEAMLARLYPGRLGFTLSIYSLGANLGDALAPLVTGALLLTQPWRLAATISVLPPVLAAVLLLVGLRRLPRRERAKDGEHPRALVGYARGLLGLVRRWSFSGVCLIAALRAMAQNGIYLFLPLYLVHALGSSALVTGSAMMSVQLAGVLGSPAGGIGSDRLGHRLITGVGLGVAALALLVLPSLDTELGVFSAITVAGFALFALRPVLSSWMMQVTTEPLRATSTSLLKGSQAAGSTLMAVVGGLAADSLGIAAVFYGLAATLAIALFLVLLVADERV